MWLRTGCLEGRAEQAERPARGPASLRRGAGVRALIVAQNPGNAGGAKEGRKVEMDQAERRTELPGLVLLLLHVAGEAEAHARSYAKLSFRARQMLMAFI